MCTAFFFKETVSFVGYSYNMLQKNLVVLHRLHSTLHAYQCEIHSDTNHLKFGKSVVVMNHPKVWDTKESWQLWECLGVHVFHFSAGVQSVLFSSTTNKDVFMSTDRMCVCAF